MDIAHKQDKNKNKTRTAVNFSQQQRLFMPCSCYVYFAGKGTTEMSSCISNIFSQIGSKVYFQMEYRFRTRKNVDVTGTLETCKDSAAEFGKSSLLNIFPQTINSFVYLFSQILNHL